MGLFDKLFNSSSETIDKKELHWIPLNSIKQLDEIRFKSRTKTQLIFKHSTRCGISSMVIKRFEKLFNESMKNTKVYYLDLLNFRDISDEVGNSFQVIHQSPQLLVIRNESSVLNVSHYDITTVDIQKYL